MKLQTNYVRPLLFNVCALDQAKRFYLPFEQLPKDDPRYLCFESDLVEYLRFGHVASGPDYFAFARVINIAPEDSNLVEPAWFIRFALGPLERVLKALPFYLPKIVWCRDNDGKLKIYSTKQLYRIAAARLKKEN